MMASSGPATDARMSEVPDRRASEAIAWRHGTQRDSLQITSDGRLTLGREFGGRQRAKCGTISDAERHPEILGRARTGEGDSKLVRFRSIYGSDRRNAIWRSHVSPNTQVVAGYVSATTTPARTTQAHAGRKADASTSS